MPTARFSSAHGAMATAARVAPNWRLVRRALLSATGGWHEDALCEDLELSSQLAILGQRVGWAADVVAWEEPVLDLGALRRQRCAGGTGSSAASSS